MVEKTRYYHVAHVDEQKIYLTVDVTVWKKELERYGSLDKLVNVLHDLIAEELESG